MKRPYSNDRGGPRGPKKFGARSFSRGNDRGGFGEQERFEAVCNNCGKPCQVPFRPNGKKPVYCSQCFKRDGAPAPSRFMGNHPSSSAPSSDSGRIEARLRSIEEKIDIILEAMDSDEE